MPDTKGKRSEKEAMGLLMKNVRKATLADLDAIVDVHVKAAPEIPVVSWRYPGIERHKAKYRRDIEEKYEKELKQAESPSSNLRFTVYELDKPDGVNDETTKKVVGFAIWRQYDKAASGNITETSGRDESIRDLQRIMGSDKRAVPQDSQENVKEIQNATEGEPGPGAEDEIKNTKRCEQFKHHFDDYIKKATQQSSHGLYWLRMLCVLGGEDLKKGEEDAKEGYRGKGFGTALVEEGIKHASKDRAFTFGLVASSDYTVDLYRQRMGFKESGSFTLSEGGEKLLVRGMSRGAGGSYPVPPSADAQEDDAQQEDAQEEGAKEEGAEGTGAQKVLDEKTKKEKGERWCGRA